MRGTPRGDDRLRAVLFDAVGTLLELREPVGETYARVARAHGVRISAWRIGDAFQRIVARAPPMVFPALPRAEVAVRERDWWRGVVRGTLRAADTSAVLDDFEHYFDALYRHYATAEAWCVTEGSLPCLRALRERGLATGVVSNFDLRLPAVLEDTGLAPWLDVVVLPGHVGAAKPDPTPFREALEQLSCKASEAVYVGDDPTRDAAGARAAGMLAIHAGELATLADLPARLAGAME
jgi:putative hydrolase of the HAD superfamily